MVFVGPPPAVLELIGNKMRGPAQAANDAGLPVLRRSGAVMSPADAQEAAAGSASRCS